MSGSKPPPSGGNPPDDKKSGAQGQSGRVTFDERGNAVWEWSMSTGIFGRNVDTKRLKKLEAHDLKIAEDTLSQKKPKIAPKSTGGGTDPYNSAGAGITPGRKPEAPAKGKPKDLKRLSEWIQLQKSLGKKTTRE
jgi:hypothetical protein